MFVANLHKSISCISVRSPFGILTIFGNNTHIYSLKWEKYKTLNTTPLLREAAQQLAAYFNKGLKNFALPIHPRGTKFQNAVWNQISKIPYGDTKTYGDISQVILTNPRAVGGACKRNPIPILIPCHRVIGGGNNLTGYSGYGGIKTKLKLLEHESYYM